MAKINNSEVIQKLIDELELYPANDLIPTELADKILPVFTINSQDVIVSPPVATFVRHGVTPATILATPIVLYTTPSTGKTYISNVQLQMHCETGAGMVADVFVSVLIDGTRQRIACLRADYDLTFNESICLNFQNPILVDAGATIIFDVTALTDATKMHGSAVVVGYTE